MLVQGLFWLLAFFSLSFFLCDSLLMVGAICLLFSITVCFLVMSVFGPWFGAVVVTVYVGGLLVMFSYFLAVSPNPAFLSGSVSLMFMVFLGLTFMWGWGTFFFLSLPAFSGYMKIDFMFSVGMGFLVFLVLFLLLCLFCVVSIVSLCGGPLRPFS